MIKKIYNSKLISHVSYTRNELVQHNSTRIFDYESSASL